MSGFHGIPVVLVVNPMLLKDSVMVQKQTHPVTAYRVFSGKRLSETEQLDAVAQFEARMKP